MTKSHKLPKQLIIIGGGTSISEGLEQGLKSLISNKFVIALNYAYKQFDNTFLCFVDGDFYFPTESAKINRKMPDIYNELAKLPLIIGNNYNPRTEQNKLPNTILLKGCGTYYGMDSIKKGIYRPTLCGLFALTLGAWLLDFEGTIFLLGYDWTRRTEEQIKKKNKIKTHYYDSLGHRGECFTGFYEKNNPNHYFEVYLKEKKLKIYNVSPNSNITSFEKISYQKMFELLDNNIYDQNILRSQISIKINKEL